MRPVEAEPGYEPRSKIQMFDMFLKIDGIPGESRDHMYKEEMQIDTFSFKQKQVGTFSHDGGGGAGKAWFGDFEFTMRSNKAGPKLFQACTTGQHIHRARLSVRKAGEGLRKETPYLAWVFEDLLISSYEMYADIRSGLLPYEKITVNYAKVACEYRVQSDTGIFEGKIGFGYNLKEQKDWQPPAVLPAAGGPRTPPR
jgi:type VI secretion system secreted protein Hcp